MSGIFGDVTFEQVALERLRVIASARIGREMSALMSQAELHTYEDFMLNQLVVQLEATVLGERLESERQRVEFEREVEWDQPYLQRTPRTTWDAWKVHHPALRRRLRLRAPRYVHGHSRVQRRAKVAVSEDIVIDRHLTYPNASIALPPDRFGHPVYVERRVR